MSVLNPEWVTQGVYKILNDKQIPQQDGLLTQNDLPRVLTGDPYPRASHDFIVDMMHKFEICFTIRQAHNWLVPELLPETEPPTAEAGMDDSLRFQYHYDVLPAGIICRFIVRRYENLTSPPIFWRSGVVLELDGCRAMVRSDKNNGRMFISVTGPEECRRSALAVIRYEFAAIHATVPNLTPKEMVPLPDNPDVAVPYDHLLTLERKRISKFVPQGTSDEYTVMQLLDGIEDKLTRALTGLGAHMLHPPFFVVTPQTTFADAWEVFCCDVLNRYNKADTIRQRRPHEGGIDLYWPDKKIAYQCKSIEDETGRFSLTKAMESIDAALKTRKNDLPWDTYILCTNVALTGDQERKLREKLPQIEFRTPSFWLPRCIEQQDHLRNRFKVLARTDELGRFKIDE